MRNFTRNLKHTLLCHAYHWLANRSNGHADLALSLRIAASRHANQIY